MPRAALAIGTATFIPGYGLRGDEATASASLIDAALRAGVSYIDTAAIYGDSESILGGFAERLSARSVRVCTKIAVEASASSAPAIEALVEQSLERLRSARIDSVLVHSADARTLRSREVARAFDRVKARGLAARTGASTYGADDARLALRQPWCDVLQVEFSVLNQGVLAAVRPRRPGCEVVARSVLCKGLLTAAWRQVPRVSEPLAPTIEALEGVARSSHESLARIAIRFALDTPGIDIVVVGVRDEAELADALAARDAAPLTPEQYDTLAAYDRSALDHVHPERWSRV
jgi:aryl-alcohol dehydrogenase-like predicted oxidoreductase